MDSSQQATIFKTDVLRFTRESGDDVAAANRAHRGYFSAFRGHEPAINRPFPSRVRVAGDDGPQRPYRRSQIRSLGGPKMSNQHGTTLLARLIAQDDRTHSEIIEGYERCARDNGEDATLSIRTLRRWMAGQVASEPRPAQRRVARLFWGYSMRELLGPPPVGRLSAPNWTDLPTLQSNEMGTSSDAGAPFIADPVGTTSVTGENLERQVAMATRRAAQFMTFAEIDNVGPEVIAQLHDDVIHLANAYNHDPVTAVLRDLPNLQELVFRLLEGRQKPAFTRDLYFLAGVVSGMLAKASHDLGQPYDAMTHARTAYVCADKAGHHPLCAWTRGLQSLISYWAGRPQEAIRYACNGADLINEHTGSVAAWLPALEARSWAVIGGHHEATQALARADDRRSTHAHDNLDSIGGLFTFPAAKHRYYAAGTYAHLEDEHQRAQHEALQALELYEHSRCEDRSYSDEAGTRAELALARVHGGEVDGAHEALVPVLELPPERRIGGIVISTMRVHQALSRRRLTDSPATRHLQEAIESFCRVPVAALPA